MPHKAKTFASFLIMAYIGGTGVAHADRASDAETLFNWAEKSYSQYFPSHDETKSASPWLYRYYSQTGVYVGLKDDNGVYVMGGAFGNAPLFVDTFENLLKTAIPAHASDAEKLFDWAETTYPQYFPSHVGTQTAGDVLYRFYAGTGIYLRVRQDESVYVEGGAFGAEHYVDTMANLLKLVSNTGSNATACSATEMPAGFSYTQNGNTVNISTNGQCVQPPSAAMCNAPTPAQATGVSVLGNTTVNSFSMGGFNILIPGFPNPFDSIAHSLANAKSCIRNAPAQGFGNLTMNIDVCYDLTAQVGSSAKSIPGVLEINPPVTMAFKAQAVNQVVSDCFATDATVVTDALTKEVWVKQNGSFVKVK